MESSKDERNSTNNENENNGLNMILVVIGKIYQLFEYKFLPDEWIKTTNIGRSKQRRVNEILNVITKAKNYGLKTNVDGREITLDNAESLLRCIASGKINGSEFKREFNNVVNDGEATEANAHKQSR